jgi:hypothetical protein
MTHGSRVFSTAGSILLLVSSGCAGAGDDVGPAPPLPADCTGQYDCQAYVDLELVGVFTGRLGIENDRCVWRDSGDGSGIDLSRPEVTIDGRNFHVRANVDGFVVAIDCGPVGSDAASAKSGSARCVGSAWSCSSVPLSECYVQDGCYYSVKNAYSTTDDRCEGSADACDDYSTRSECEHQRGCTWQP